MTLFLHIPPWCFSLTLSPALSRPHTVSVRLPPIQPWFTSSVSILYAHAHTVTLSAPCLCGSPEGREGLRKMASDFYYNSACTATYSWHRKRVARVPVDLHATTAASTTDTLTRPAICRNHPPKTWSRK